MNKGSQLFKFLAQEEPSVIIGERVVVQVPLELPPKLGELRNLSVHEFCKHVEQQMLELKRKYGSDTDQFELAWKENGAISVIFTRPMDRLELAQVRAQRARDHEPQQPQADFADSIPGEDDERRLRLHDLPLDRDGHLPDPSVLRLPQLTK